MKDGKRVGVLDEDFTYSDGTKQKRIWTLTELSPGRYSGTASDVIAKPLERWPVMLLIGDTHSPYPWMAQRIMFSSMIGCILMDDKVMLNKAAMSKFGIYLGEVTLAFYKR